MKTTEIPKLISELFEMSKSYLEQEAVAPLRRTARFAGISLLGGFLFALGWLFLAVAGLRLIQTLLPDTPLWSVLAYVIGGLAALAGAVAVIWAANRSKASP